MNYNYYALTVSIIKGCTCEQAFELMETGHLRKGKIFNTDNLNGDIVEMIDLKASGFTYKQIGEMFSISDGAVYTRIRRATGRLKPSYLGKQLAT